MRQQSRGGLPSGAPRSTGWSTRSAKTSHPLAERLDLLASQTEAWAAHRLQLPRAEPSEALRLLMQ